ncbi:monooxygenase [Leclercia adecarboxylata]|uniref:monooxygenase n=1 Tax=Leclercia adecarboxylata TaxID=83655 RepID=UPI0013E00BF7|nr:monooxygenase [Leclercia adecarboxylata]QIG30758.1 monooxygenase [Leclercia adecarboxylata]
MQVKINAKSLAKFHLILALVWAMLTIPTLLWWKNSILWVSLMSIYAIVVSHLAAYSAAHAEKAANNALNQSEETKQKTVMLPTY